MAEMQMPLPDNTLPMMTGDGPFGALEMGGMFSVVKVRDDTRPGDYRDPGWFKHPAKTVPHEYTAEDGDDAPRAAQPKADSQTLQVRKPTGHEGH
jgi:hypothetical protein